MGLAWTMNKTFQPRQSKYRAVKTKINDITFASKKEAKRYSELMFLMRAGRILQLKLQPEFELLVPMKYRADFSYYDLSGNLVVEDVKGFKTREYKRKKKYML